MKVLEVCEQCQHRHVVDFDPLVPTTAFHEWYTKHAGHDSVKFLFPQRRLKHRILDQLNRVWRWRGMHRLFVECLDTREDAFTLPSKYAAFLPNADIKSAYAASSAPTMTLASLAASSSLLGGRESTSITNTYLDYLVAGHYRTGSANLQAGRILTTLVGARDDTPSWPDVFDGTDSVETVTTQDIFNSICRIAGDNVTDATQRTWPWGPISVEILFGKIPKNFVFFVTHNAHTTTAVWSATEGDHSIRMTPVYGTVI